MYIYVYYISYVYIYTHVYEICLRLARVRLESIVLFIYRLFCSYTGTCMYTIFVHIQISMYDLSVCVRLESIILFIYRYMYV